MSKLSEARLAEIRVADEIARNLMVCFEDCDEYKRTAAFMEAIKLAFKNRGELLAHIDYLTEAKRERSKGNKPIRNLP
jgi:hypothetical protein